MEASMPALFTKIDHTLNQISVLRKGAVASRSWGIAKNLGGDLRESLTSAGGIAQMGAMGALGGGAGYLRGDGDWGSTAKGVGLGVLGGAAMRGFGVARQNTMFRAGLSDAKAWGVAGARRSYQQRLAREMAAGNKASAAFSRLSDHRPGVRIANGMSVFPNAPF
jgi:hypothetical protein